MLKHFNGALDALRGDGTEGDLAKRLGISTDVLLKYRRGEFPKGMGKIAAQPHLLSALALDAIETPGAEHTEAAEITG